jgi:23S rRNA (adenine2503-C2)-methyltransferase
MPSLADLPAVEALRRALRLDPQAMRAVRTALYKRFADDAAVLRAIPEPQRSAFAEQAALHCLTLHDRRDSQHDGASKLLFRTAGGALLETVILRIASGRTSLCLSSQVGCAAACTFCATGQLGIVQHLTVDEILDQCVQAGQLLAHEGRQARNLVFMGMGEPFHNEEPLHAALRALTAPELFHHPPHRILVSTVGIPDAMVRCAQRFPQVRLALSLHSVEPAVREQLIPLARKYPLDALRQALRAVHRAQGPRTSVMIEYLTLDGLNDQPHDARRLAEWLAGLRVHVNLIPYNPIAGAEGLRSSDRSRRDAFAAVLRDAGYPTTVRYSLGSDIAAACGQLAKAARGRGPAS